MVKPTANPLTLTPTTTHMKKIWGESEIIKVQFNEYGQPIDKKTTSQLILFMGAVARGGKYFLIHKPWTKVSDTKKQTLLELLKVHAKFYSYTNVKLISLLM